MEKYSKIEIKSPTKQKIKTKDLENFKNRQISKIKNKESTIIKSSISNFSLKEKIQEKLQKIQGENPRKKIKSNEHIITQNLYDPYITSKYYEIMDDEKIETLDRVSILQRGVEDDKHLTAIFSSTKKPEITAIFNKEPAKKALIDLSELEKKFSTKR